MNLYKERHDIKTSIISSLSFSWLLTFTLEPSLVNLEPEKMSPPELQLRGRKTFRLISECDLSSVRHHSIAADLDGTLLKSKLSFPYYILIAIAAGSLLRGLILLLSLPIITALFFLVSEDLAGKLLIFFTFSGIKLRDIEIASRSILPRFYAADVRRDCFEVFEKCERKVIVTANPVVMVDAFAKEFLGAEKVIGTEIEVDLNERATGFVKEPGFLVGRWKKVAIVKEFGEDLPDIGIGDRRSDHEFMSICKASYMVPIDHFASLVPPQCLKTRLDRYPKRRSSSMIRLPLRFLLYPFRAYFNRSLLEGIVKCVYRRVSRQSLLEI